MTREGIHRLVDNHAEEVQPMLDRLATTYPLGHLDEAAAALTNAGRRFKWASELEHALLAQLGHDVATGRPRPEHQRARTMNEPNASADSEDSPAPTAPTPDGASTPPRPGPRCHRPPAPLREPVTVVHGVGGGWVIDRDGYPGAPRGWGGAPGDRWWWTGNWVLFGRWCVLDSNT